MKRLLRWLLIPLGALLLLSVLSAALGSLVHHRLHHALDPIQQPVPGSILHLKLDGKVVSYQAKAQEGEALGMNQIVYALEQASDDPDIIGVHLELASERIEAGWATLHALRKALVRFKAHTQKPVVCAATTYNQATLALGSAADRVLLSPAGYAFLSGPSYTSFYYKELLEQWGVQALVFRAGTYKSIAEPYLRNDMSPAHRAQMERILHALSSYCLEDIQTSRGLSKETLEQLANTNPLLTPSEALELQLVDQLGGRRAVDQYFNLHFDFTARMAGMEQQAKEAAAGVSVAPQQAAAPQDNTVDELALNRVLRKTLDRISVRAYYRYCKSKEPELSPSTPRMVIVPIRGELTDRPNEQGKVLIEELIEALDTYAQQEQVRGIILAIDSPGGETIATERLREAIVRTREQGKKVVCYIANIAASGGYCLAAACDAIIAPKEAITGSIGVMSVQFVLQPGLQQWLHLHTSTVTSHPHANVTKAYRYQMPDPATQRLLQKQVDYCYERFLDGVAQGRGMTRQAVQEAAEGRVWIAEDALQHQLIDSIGTLEDAIAWLRQEADLGECPVVYHHKSGSQSFLRNLLAGPGYQSQADKLLRGACPYLKHRQQLARAQGLQALWPYQVHYQGAAL